MIQAAGKDPAPYPRGLRWAELTPIFLSFSTCSTEEKAQIPEHADMEDFEGLAQINGWTLGVFLSSFWKDLRRSILPSAA